MKQIGFWSSSSLHDTLFFHSVYTLQLKDLFSEEMLTYVQFPLDSSSRISETIVDSLTKSPVDFGESYVPDEITKSLKV